MILLISFHCLLINIQPGNVTGSCEDLGDGYYPVVTDCTKYLWCYDNGNATRPCATGTVYNPNASPCGTKLECSDNIIRKPPSEGKVMS